MILHAPLVLVAGLFAYSLATASPEVRSVVEDAPAAGLTFAALR
jgi:hypothetical protein